MGDPELDAAARGLLEALGYAGEPPEMLERWFRRGQGALLGDVVDDRPLSETSPIRAWTDDGRNPLEWLLDAARASLDALRLQDGFTDDHPPTALLYLLLRHALILGYADASYELHRAADVLSPAELSALKAEPEFVHVAEANGSREPLGAALRGRRPRDRRRPRARSPSTSPRRSWRASRAAMLREQLEALEALTQLPTARLERVLAEHLDLCAYRLDAWLLGLVEPPARRDARRAATARHGVHLGAYAWLEDVRPKRDAARAGAARRRPRRDLRARRRPAAHPRPVQRRAPARAVARPRRHRGGAAQRLPGQRRPVQPRLARGQPLVRARAPRARRSSRASAPGRASATLLGYRLERGLHDRHELAEVDRFIFVLRKAFPLRADQLASTQTGADVPIEAIEARNVIDGLAARRAGAASGHSGVPVRPRRCRPRTTRSAPRSTPRSTGCSTSTTPWPTSRSRRASTRRCRATTTASPARSSSYTTGSFPPEPDVVRTPTTGSVLTHRVGLHLDRTATAPPGATPRAVAEPAVDAWLAGVLPPLDDIACRVLWRHPVTDVPGDAVVTMADLGLRPADLLSLVGRDTGQAMTELDDRVLARVLATGAVPRRTPRWRSATPSGRRRA